MSQTANPVSRRRLFAGAGTLGAVAAAAGLLPGLKPQVAEVVEVQPPPPANGGGYRLSEHVKRYYKTTLV